jgi:hypothetical protein
MSLGQQHDHLVPAASRAFKDQSFRRVYR